MSEKKKKILIIKIGAIGDVIMALYMLDAIKQRYKSSHITWLCGKEVEPVLRLIKEIDSIVPIDEKKLFKGNIFTKGFLLTKIWLTFFGKYFYVIFIPNRDIRYRLLSLFILSRKKKSWGKNSRKENLIPGRYHGDEYARLVTDIDDFRMNELKLPNIEINKIEWINNLFKESNTEKVIINPGGAKNILNEDKLRRWPIENYVSLAEKLIDEGKTVLIIGSKTDEYTSNYFQKLSVINLIGRTSLVELLYLFNCCNLLISHDTAAIHLSKLAPIKVIALFGPVNPDERVGINETIEVIWEGKNLVCSPCYDGKKFADCENNICMQKITVDQVFNKATELIIK